jgi:hypothetical protein
MIEANAEQILEEVGVNFVNNPAALERWREAGATIEGERVRIPKGLARELCKTAPASFTQHARNPERNVVIGGNVVQSGNPDGSISGGIDNRSRLDFNPPSGGSGGGNAQTAAEATAAVEAKKKEIDDGLFALALQDPIKYGLKGINFTDFGDTFGADDQKAMSMKFDRENQILNNLLIAEQQAKNRGAKVMSPERTFATADHNTPTINQHLPVGTVGRKPWAGTHGIGLVAGSASPRDGPGFGGADVKIP